MQFSPLCLYIFVEFFHLLEFLSFRAFLSHFWCKFKESCPENDRHSHYLQQRGGVFVENYAYNHCQNFSESYDEGDDVLLELFDHSVDKYLAKEACKWIQNDLKSKKFMLSHKRKNSANFKGGNSPKQAKNCNPFIDLFHHLSWMRLELRLNYSLEIRQ